MNEQLCVADSITIEERLAVWANEARLDRDRWIDRKVAEVQAIIREMAMAN